jgi:hypothetical protein
VSKNKENLMNELMRMPAVPHRCLRCRAKWESGKAFGQLFERVDRNDCARYACGSRIYVSNRDINKGICSLYVSNCGSRTMFMSNEMRFDFLSEYDYFSRGV